MGSVVVVAPITEASAEYQAIAYALDTPGVELVLVDRSADHVFQWDDRGEKAAEDGEAAPEEPEAGLHGEAVGVEIGDLRPRFSELEEHLLRHGKVRHWSEWWHQYVEVPLGDSAADHDTYRQVMFLIGSLFRRLAPGDGARVRVDEDRERYMWTRMREHMAATGPSPRTRCTCAGPSTRPAGGRVRGGRQRHVHHLPAYRHDLAVRADPVQQRGDRGAVRPRRGLGVDRGDGVGEEPQAHACAAVPAGGSDGWQAAPREEGRAGPAGPGLLRPCGGFRRRGPAVRVPAAAARDRRVGRGGAAGWSVDIVRAARRNGYLASTADAIAVFETSILLAGMRDRAKPTPYDFQDAAVTCIEKDVVPGRRDVRRLVEIMMGGDRIGQVGYEALPPLAATCTTGWRRWG